MRNVVKLLSILLLASFVGMGIASCTKDVTGVKLSKNALTMEVGDTETLTATVEPSGANQAVTWETSNEDVVVVTNGTVTAKGVGKARITVRTDDGNKTDVCEVTVEPKMADNFNCTFGVGFFQGSTKISSPFNIPGIPEDFTGYAISGVKFLVYVENNTAGVIPKGTPCKVKVTINSKVVPGQAGDIIDIEIGEDIPVGSTRIICQIANSAGNFPLDPTYCQMGTNNVCAELIQLGKLPYSSSRSDCAAFNLQP